MDFKLAARYPPDKINLKGDKKVDRIKEINTFIRQAELMAGELKPKTSSEEVIFFTAAMNWLTHRAGLRVLTPSDIKTAEELYGPLQKEK